MTIESSAPVTGSTDLIGTLESSDTKAAIPYDMNRMELSPGPRSDSIEVADSKEDVQNPHVSFDAQRVFTRSWRPFSMRSLSLTMVNPKKSEEDEKAQEIGANETPTSTDSKSKKPRHSVRFANRIVDIETGRAHYNLPFSKRVVSIVSFVLGIALLILVLCLALFWYHDPVITIDLQRSNGTGTFQLRPGSNTSSLAFMVNLTASVMISSNNLLPTSVFQVTSQYMAVPTNDAVTSSDALKLMGVSNSVQLVPQPKRLLGFATYPSFEIPSLSQKTVVAPFQLQYDSNASSDGLLADPVFYNLIGACGVIYFPQGAGHHPKKPTWPSCPCYVRRGGLRTHGSWRWAW